MAEFRIEIAGKVFAVRSLFDSTKDYCHAYLTDADAAFSVTVTREDIAFEQRFLDEEADEEGFRRRKFTDPFLERAAIQRAVAEALISCRTLLIHGSAIAADGKGYLFTAKSGTGKSTHTRLWRQLLGDRAVMINDDKPFIRLTEDGAQLCGAPWSGKHGLDTNITVPLAGICLLERGEQDAIAPLGKEDLLALLRQHGCPPLAQEKLAQYDALLQELAAVAAGWKMACTKDPNAALVAHTAMSQA